MSRRGEERRRGRNWRKMPPTNPSSPPGEATAGKTQLTLRLLLTAQLPSSSGGLGGAALYFWTKGGDPPLRRLAELAAHVPGV